MWRNLKNRIPNRLKRLAIWVRVFFIMLLRGRPGPGDIRVCLAGQLPRGKKVIHGGKVKLLHLRERFGDSLRRFNLLYLVSSTLPSNADIWIRCGRMFGVPTVWNQNGVAYPGWAGERAERLNAPLRVIHHADHVVYQSEFCKTSADRHLGAFTGPSSVLFNPIGLERFIPAARPPANGPVLVIMGNHFTPEKVVIPLRALAHVRNKLPDARLLLVGKLQWPNAEHEIAAVIDELGLARAVQRHGPYLQDDAPELYRRGHIFLHLKYHDPCPTAVIEALACGLPVIGSRSGGMPELVPPEAGILLDVPMSWDVLHYPPAQAVAAAITAVWNDWPRYRNGAREAATVRYDAQRWLDAHERIFEEIINR